MIALASFRAELRANPTLWRMVLVATCAALGSALPDIITAARQVLS